MAAEMIYDAVLNAQVLVDEATGKVLSSGHPALAAYIGRHITNLQADLQHPTKNVGNSGSRNVRRI